MTQDERFDRIDANIERIGAYIQDFRSETIQRFTRLEHRLEGLSAAIASVDARLPAPTKSVFDAHVFTA